MRVAAATSRAGRRRCRAPSNRGASSRSTATHGGSSPTIGTPARACTARSSTVPRRMRGGSVELAGRDPRQPAAPWGVRHLDAVPGVLEHPDRRDGHLGVEPVAEGVGPQQDRRPIGEVPRGGARGSPREGPGERGRCEAGQVAALVDPRRPPRQPCDGRHVERARGQSRGQPGEPRPAGELAEGVVAARAETAPVGPVQRLGLVGGDVHAGGAVHRAALAGQAQVERVVQLGRREPVRHQPPVDHLLQDARSSAGRVLLVAGGEVGRTHHRAAFGAVGSARADADAAVHRRAEVAPVLGVGEPSGDRRHGRRQSQVGIGGARSDEHPGVEHAVRVEGGLERGERVEHLRRVHPWQQLGARPTVAVLPGHRPTEAGDEVGRVLEEPAEHADAAVRSTPRTEGEVDARVDATVAEVAVGERGQTVVDEQRVEGTQVVAEPRGWHGRVLPPGVGGLAVRREPRRQRRPVLADAPERAGGGDVVDLEVGGGAGVGQQPPCRRTQLAEVVTGQFHEQPRRTLGQRGDRGRSAPPDHGVDDATVDALHRDGPVGEQAGHGVASRGDVRVPEHHQQGGGRDGHQPERGVEDERAGALAADECAGEVGAVPGQQVVEAVAGHLAGEAVEVRADGVGVPLGQPDQRRVERGGARVVRGTDGQLVADVPSQRPPARRCRPCARTRAHGCHRRCCRASRRSCSGRGSTDPVRSAARAVRRHAADR